jgi:pantetheine-phosphate adenylyltransferase
VADRPSSSELPGSARVASRIAVYPGSFDPITLGHVDIVERAARLFDQVVVAIGRHPTKHGYFDVDARCDLVARSITHVANATVSAFTGLVIDFCRERGARVLVRGLRATADFEPEFQMGLANRDLAPEIETVFLIPPAPHIHVSSSLVREIASLGGAFERYVSPAVAEAMHARTRASTP